MADSYIQVQPDSTGKKLDTELLTVGANAVHRERMQVAGASALEIASVVATAPTTEYGLVVRNIPSGTQPVSAVSLPLPSGASTSALQTTGNTSLSSIDGKTPALGQALAAASVPVVLTAAQITTLTPLATVAVTQSGSWTVGTKETPDATATYAPSGSDSAAYVASQVAKAGAGVLFGITGYNSAATGQFIQVHNTTTLPANGAVPIVIFWAAALDNFFWSPGEKFGKFFSTGITICNSSTGPTKTIWSADCWFNAQYS